MDRVRELSGVTEEEGEEIDGEMKNWSRRDDRTGDETRLIQER